MRQFGIDNVFQEIDMRPYIEELSGIADCYVSCYPNAGLPNAFGEYDELPETTAGYLQEFAQAGFVNLLGIDSVQCPQPLRKAYSSGVYILS